MKSNFQILEQILIIMHKSFLILTKARRIIWPKMKMRVKTSEQLLIEKNQNSIQENGRNVMTNDREELLNRIRSVTEEEHREIVHVVEEVYIDNERYNELRSLLLEIIDRIPDGERVPLLTELQSERPMDAEPTSEGPMDIHHCADLLGRLYAMGNLDCVIQLAEAVHRDTLEIREHYRLIPLEDYRRFNEFARLGNEPCWPDSNMRLTIYSSLLGPYEAEKTDDSSHEFHNHSANLRRAAKLFSEDPRVAPEHRSRSGFLSAGTALREFLLRLCGTGLEVGISDIGNVFNNARLLISNPNIARVFNAQPISGQDWPLNGPHGSDLIKKISQALEPRLDSNTFKILQDKFTNLQQVTQYGSSAIILLLRDDWEDWAGPLPMLIEHTHE
jgi:hypothetical protein